jgi:hypothetical protein
VTAAQVCDYARHPRFTILRNDTRGQGVKENVLRLTGVNVWVDGGVRVGDVWSTDLNGCSVEVRLAAPTPSPKSAGPAGGASAEPATGDRRPRQGGRHHVRRGRVRGGVPAGPRGADNPPAN